MGIVQRSQAADAGKRYHLLVVELGGQKFRVAPMGQHWQFALWHRLIIDGLALSFNGRAMNLYKLLLPFPRVA